MRSIDQARPTLPVRTALLSILAFWTFYFSIVTLRSVVTECCADQWSMLGQRAIVSLISSGATLLLYVAIRRSSASTFRRNILATALLAVPAAFIYATVNYAMFDTDLPGRIVTAAQNRNALQILTLGAPVPYKDMSPFDEILSSALNGYFYFVTWGALYLLLCHGVEVRALERRATELTTAAQSAELRALRYQINPHFLFNTLNSLSALVLSQRRDDAEKMIATLAAFLRTSLVGDPTADLPLSEEIFLQKLYLEIESVRFPERLAVAIDVPATLMTARVPGMILQPLVENAVRHGVARSRNRVTLRVIADQQEGHLVLTVMDDGDGAGDGARPGGGLGLRNVRDRLAARFGDAAALAAGPDPDGGYAARITMPLDRDGR